MMRLLPTKTIMGTVVKHSDGTLICQEEVTKNRASVSAMRGFLLCLSRVPAFRMVIMPLPLLGVRFSSCHIGLALAVQCFKGSVVQAHIEYTIHGKEPPSSDGSLSENVCANRRRCVISL